MNFNEKVYGSYCVNGNTCRLVLSNALLTQLTSKNINNDTTFEAIVEKGTVLHLKKVRNGKYTINTEHGNVNGFDWPKFAKTCGISKLKYGRYQAYVMADGSIKIYWQKSLKVLGTVKRNTYVKVTKAVTPGETVSVDESVSANELWLSMMEMLDLKFKGRTIRKETLVDLSNRMIELVNQWNR